MKITPRFLTLFLCLALGLPAPSYALRAETPIEAGAEERISSRLSSGVLAPSPLAAGAEGTESLGAPFGSIHLGRPLIQPTPGNFSIVQETVLLTNVVRSLQRAAYLPTGTAFVTPETITEDYSVALRAIVDCLPLGEPQKQELIAAYEQPNMIFLSDAAFVKGLPYIVSRLGHEKRHLAFRKLQSEEQEMLKSFTAAVIQWGTPYAKDFFRGIAEQADEIGEFFDPSGDHTPQEMLVEFSGTEKGITLLLEQFAPLSFWKTGEFDKNQVSSLLQWLHQEGQLTSQESDALSAAAQQIQSAGVEGIADLFDIVEGEKTDRPTVLFLFPPGDKVIAAYRGLAGRIFVLKEEREPSGVLDQELLRKMVREIDPEYLATFVNDQVDAALLSEEVTPRLKGITHMGLGTNNIDLKAAAERGLKVSYVGGGANPLRKATAEMADALALTAWFNLTGRLEPADQTTPEDRLLGPFLRGYLEAHPQERYPGVWQQAADLMWAQLLRRARRVDAGIQLARTDKFRGAGNGGLRTVRGHQLSGDAALGIKTGLGLIGPTPLVERWREIAKAHEVFRVVTLADAGSYDQLARSSDYVLRLSDSAGAIPEATRTDLNAERDYPWLIDADRLALKQDLPVSNLEALFSRPLKSQTLGFLGLGSVGATALQSLQPFAGRLLGVRQDSGGKTDYDRLADQFGIGYTDLDSLLTESDVVLLALPGSGEAVGLVNPKRLERLGIQDTLFVNVGRGTAFAKSVKEEARFADYLRSHPGVRLATDVLFDETLPRDRQPLLAEDLEGQVLVTAHIASNAEQPGGPSVREDGMGMGMFENFKAMVNDQPLPNPAPPAAGAEEKDKEWPLWTVRKDPKGGYQVHVGEGKWIRSAIFDLGTFQKPLLKILRKPGVLRPEMSVLEIGVGEGPILVAMANHVQWADGVEIHSGMAQRARENLASNGLKNAEVLVGDMTAPIQGRKYDLIVSSPAAVPFSRQMEMIIQDEQVRLGNDGGRDGRRMIERILREAPASLKPGGAILMTHPEFVDLKKTRALSEELGLRMEILLKHEARMIRKKDFERFFLAFRENIKQAHGIHFLRKQGRWTFQIYILRFTRPSPSPAAGAEQKPGESSSSGWPDFVQWFLPDVPKGLDGWVDIVLRSDEEVRRMLRGSLSAGKQLYLAKMDSPAIPSGGYLPINAQTRASLTRSLGMKAVPEAGFVLVFGKKTDSLEKTRTVLRHEAGHIAVEAAGGGSFHGRNLRDLFSRLGSRNSILMADALFDQDVIDFQLRENLMDSVGDYAEKTFASLALGVPRYLGSYNDRKFIAAFCYSLDRFRLWPALDSKRHARAEEIARDLDAAYTPALSDPERAFVRSLIDHWFGSVSNMRAMEQHRLVTTVGILVIGLWGRFYLTSGLEELMDAARGPVREIAEQGEGGIAVLMDPAIAPGVTAADLEAMARHLRRLSGYPMIEIKFLTGGTREQVAATGARMIRLKIFSEGVAADPDTVYLQAAAGLERGISKQVLPLLITDAVARWQRAQDRTVTAPPIVLPAAPYLNAAGVEQEGFADAILSDRFA